MNILDTQDNLKGMSEQQLMQEMQAPSGQAPQFLVLSEITRRKRMRDDMSAQQGKPPTVAQQAVAAAGVPQEGLGQMALALAPNTDQAGNTGIASLQQAPQRLAEGGQVQRLAPGGQVGSSYPAPPLAFLRDPAIQVMAERVGVRPGELWARMSPQEREITVARLERQNEVLMTPITRQDEVNRMVNPPGPAKGTVDLDLVSGGATATNHLPYTSDRRPWNQTTNVPGQLVELPSSPPAAGIPDSPPVNITATRPLVDLLQTPALPFGRTAESLPPEVDLYPTGLMDTGQGLSATGVMAPPRIADVRRYEDSTAPPPADDRTWAQRNIGDSLRAAFAPVGDAGRAAFAPVGDAGRAAGAYVNENSPRFVLGPAPVDYVPDMTGAPGFREPPRLQLDMTGAPGFRDEDAMNRARMDAQATRSAPQRVDMTGAPGYREQDAMTGAPGAITGYDPFSGQTITLSAADREAARRRAEDAAAAGREAWTSIAESANALPPGVRDVPPELLQTMTPEQIRTAGDVTTGPGLSPTDDLLPPDAETDTTTTTTTTPPGPLAPTRSGGTGGTGGTSSYEQYLMGAAQRAERSAEQNKWLALAQFGAQLAAGATTPGGGLGEAASAGLGAFREGQISTEERRMKIAQMQAEWALAQQKMALAGRSAATRKPLASGIVTALMARNVDIGDQLATMGNDPATNDQRKQLGDERRQNAILIQQALYADPAGAVDPDSLDAR